MTKKQSIVALTMCAILITGLFVLRSIKNEVEDAKMFIQMEEYFNSNIKRMNPELPEVDIERLNTLSVEKRQNVEEIDGYVTLGRFLISTIVILVALILILRGDKSTHEQQKWAYGIIGIVLGHWFG